MVFTLVLVAVSIHYYRDAVVLKVFASTER